MFGMLFIVCCRWLIIVWMWLLCLFSGLRLICRWVLFSVGLVLLMLMKEVRFFIVGFLRIMLVICCWCLVMLVKEIDCGVWRVFWIMLLFWIGKKFFGIKIYRIIDSVRVFRVMLSVSYGWFSIWFS